MKLKNIYIALGLSLLLPSCKSDEPAPAPMEKAYVSFTLSLSNGGTRANDPFNHEWVNDGDDAGIKFDNKILDNSVTPVLYAAPGGTIVSDVPVGEITEVTKVTDDEKGTVTFTGALKTSLNIDQLKDGNYRLAVYVNSTSADLCGNGINIKSPESTVFHHHGTAGDTHGDNDQAFNGIPMYGVADISFEGIVPANHTSKDNAYTLKNGNQDLVIPMLRAMGKIRITVDKDNEGKKNDKNEDIWLGTTRKLKLKKFEISKHNTQGYVVPKSWDKITSVMSLSTTKAFNPVAGSSNGTPTTQGCTVFPGTSGEGNSAKMLQFYLPETMNDQTAPIKLTVWYSVDGNEKETEWLKNEFYISQGGAENATHWDIFRNTIYEFNIVGVKENFKLDLEVSVKDWVHHKISITL